MVMIVEGWNRMRSFPEGSAKWAVVTHLGVILEKYDST